MKIRSLLIVLLVSLGVVSCNPDSLDVTNESQYDFETYFSGEKPINQAVISLYSSLLHNGLYAREYYFIFDLIGNDAETDIALLGDLRQLATYSFPTSHNQITALWQTLYRIQLRSNVVIDRTEAWQPTLAAEQAKKTQFLGEARFFKGYSQFLLTSLWGRVPLKRDFKGSLEVSTARSSVAEGWAVCESDLKAAITALPLTYPATERGRVTRGAAQALLGRVLLFQGKFAEAATELTKLTQTPYTYALNPSYDAQFSETNNMSAETVFDVNHRWLGWGEGNAFYMFGGQESWGGKTTHSGRGMEYGFDDWQNVLISVAAVQAFKYNDEQGRPYTDPRAAFTFYGDEASGGDTKYCDACTATIPFPFATKSYRWRKYQNYETRAKEDIPQSNINSQAIRYADVLLMLAEALIESNRAADALPHINAVRTRSKAFAYNSLGDQANARSIVRRERRLELCGEQSRWFDLARWGTARATLNAEKNAIIPNSNPFRDFNVLLPIPALERQTNPALSSDIANDWN